MANTNSMCASVMWLKSNKGQNRRLGGAQPGNRFVSFVRAHARSGSEVGIGKNGCPMTLSLFPFWLRMVFRSSFVWF